MNCSEIASRVHDAHRSRTVAIPIHEVASCYGSIAGLEMRLPFVAESPVRCRGARDLVPVALGEGVLASPLGLAWAPGHPGSGQVRTATAVLTDCSALLCAGIHVRGRRPRSHASPLTSPTAFVEGRQGRATVLDHAGCGGCEQRTAADSGVARAAGGGGHGQRRARHGQGAGQSSGGYGPRTD